MASVVPVPSELLDRPDTVPVSRRITRLTVDTLADLVDTEALLELRDIGIRGVVGRAEQVSQADASATASVEVATLLGFFAGLVEGANSVPELLGYR